MKTVKKVNKVPKTTKKTSVSSAQKIKSKLLQNKWPLILLAVVVFGLSGAWLLNRSSAATSWTLAWSDEFDGTSLNLSNWGVYNNTYGDGNKEEECSTPNNVTVSGGTLKITSKREEINCMGDATKHRSFTSGFIATRSIGSTGSSATASGKYFPAYAKYEMRAKLPHGQGLWPAFWLRHKDGASMAEIDIMEYFHATVPGKTTGTLHYNNVHNVAKKSVAFEAPTVSPGWHTWGVMTEDTSAGVLISWQLDGNTYFQYTETDKSQFTKYADAFDIALNMAVGGTYVGHPDDALGYSRYTGKCLQPYGGSQPCDTSGILRAGFPSVYEVDYVRVFTKTTTPDPVVAPTPTPTPTPTPAPAPTVTKLATPSNLKAVAKDGSVSLTWNAVSGANNYTVRWGQNGTWTNYSNNPGSTNPTTNSYTISGLKNGQTYQFSVAARDSTGKSTGSDYATPITAVPVVAAILVPQNVKVVSGSSKFTLSWAKSTDSRVDVYSPRYIRSDSKNKSDGSAWIYPGRTSNLSYTVTGLQKGVSYDVQVRAIDTRGTSTTSDDIHSEYSPVLVVKPY
ncbi:MAG: family 16 glycosylhydrolase [Candidatus Saccharimonadales bacterium]